MVWSQENRSHLVILGLKGLIQDLGAYPSTERDARGWELLLEVRGQTWKISALPFSRTPGKPAGILQHL